MSQKSEYRFSEEDMRQRKYPCDQRCAQPGWDASLTEGKLR
jgi:hypothetical protein